MSASGRRGGRALRQQPAHDRIGDGLRINPILALADLLLDLGDAHAAVSFPYRLGVTDQLWG